MAASFPVRQMVILAICRFAEPVASTSVYPYIPEMVASFNVPTDQIGVYSGWLSAVFSLCQAITGIAWGRASDKLGRKPMILLALLSIMVSSVAFGFSTSLPMAFITRSLQGASSGNVGIIRTVVAEMVPQKELQPRAFSIMPLVWNIGSIFGPSIGGFLSNPQRNGWFSSSHLLKEYPYALPNLTISALFVIGIAAGVLFLKETHTEKKHRKDYGLVAGEILTSSCSKRKKSQWTQDEDEADPFLNGNGSAMTSPITWKSPRTPMLLTRKPSWSEIFSRQSTINLIAYTGLAMHSVAFDQLMPVFMHHPVSSTESRKSNSLQFTGGFGLDSGRIGVLFTVYGIFGMLVQFFLFPPLARRYGVLKCFKCCAVVFPCVYLVIPFTSLLSTTGLRQGVCLALMLVKCAAGIFAFPCSTILLTNSATSLNILGTLNGVATSISAMGRAAGPAITGWAFTLGVDIGYIVIPFWFLLTVSLLAAIPIWLLVEMEGFNAPVEDLENDEAIEDEVDNQDRIRLETNNSGTTRRKGGLGILAGTEDDDPFDDDIHPIEQSTLRPGVGIRRRSSNYSLHKVTSPVGTGSTGVAKGLVRRYSTDLGTSRSGLGTGGSSFQ